MIEESLYIAAIEDTIDGVDSISFVKSPAIGVNFSYAKDNEGNILVDAPVLLANKEIFQNNEAYGQHYILFLPDTVKKIMDRFSENRNTYKFNIEHSELSISGVHFVESYQVDYSRGLKPFSSIGNVHDGSWVARFKIKNEDLINKIESKEVSGVSITGAFSFTLVEDIDLLKMNLL